MVPLLSDHIHALFPTLLRTDTTLLLNPSGSFTIGGPYADTGITGRKIMVDTYGTLGPHGGGSFSGKDPTKIDKSGAYAARYIAKNIVASGVTPTCTVQLSYAIGRSDPLEVDIEAQCDTEKLTRTVKNHFPLRPADIIQAFDLQRPIYQALAFDGHFGHDHPWEKLDKADFFTGNKS